MSKTNNYLKDIYYISVPEEFSKSINDFDIDTKIKLPIETNGIDNWDPETLSWESIISAMLKIMAYDSENENINYYRDFVKAVRPNIVHELTDSAIFKSSEKKFNLAKEIFLAINSLDPENDRNKLNLAVLYENESEWHHKNGDLENEKLSIELARKSYVDLLNKETVLNDTYFNSGYFFIKVREFEKAEICLNSFIEYSNDGDKIEKARETLNEYKNIINNEDIFSSVYSSILNEDEASAIKSMSEFISNNDKVWNAWFLLGWAYRRLSNFSEALVALQKALALNNKIADIYNELSICYMELDDFTNCQKSLEQALKLTPEDVKIISNMGILQLKMGNKESAKKYFETVLVFDEDDSIAKLYLEQL